MGAPPDAGRRSQVPPPHLQFGEVVHLVDGRGSGVDVGVGGVHIVHICQQEEPVGLYQRGHLRTAGCSCAAWVLSFRLLLQCPTCTSNCPGRYGLGEKNAPSPPKCRAGHKTGALLERLRSDQCPAQPLLAYFGWELPVPLPAPAVPHGREMQHLSNPTQKSGCSVGGAARSAPGVAAHYPHTKKAAALYALPCTMHTCADSVSLSPNRSCSTATVSFSFTTGMAPVCERMHSL